jgi:acyl transferase domain-containing protein/phosphopantetheinyl transferase
MACIFPGAPDLSAYWKNIQSGFDAIEDVPPSRWEPRFYDPDSDAPDRFYCKRGGFIDAFADFDPTEFGIMPVAAQSAEPDQLLALKVAAQALIDAGVKEGKIKSDQTGVILGRGAYMTAGMTRLVQKVRTAEQLLVALKTLVPGLSEDQLAAVKDAFQSRVEGCGPDGAIGLVPNLAASRIANRLDLNGPAYTVDAACASALMAVDQACRALAAGQCDAVLAGGVHLTHDVTFWSVFRQLGVLSRSQQMRPFDRRADGLLMGEGVGMVVLRRFEDAVKDKNRIYAVIRGTGISSDGRIASLMQPGVDGQVLALKRAWAAAGLDPKTVGLIEAHGTATAAGDAAEIETLTRVFGPPEGGKRAGLGTVKSQIGHTMPAAGIAGLIKAALAVYNKILPPTLHCDQPNPDLEKTRFRLIQKAEPWEDRPRLAGVNAFGFGGINAHVVLESIEQKVEKISARPRARILTLAADTVEQLQEKLETGAAGGEGPVRLAVLDPTPEKLEKAKNIAGRARRWPGRGGIWFSPNGLMHAGGKVAFLFPGVDASFKPRVDDIAEHFGLPAPEHTSVEGLEKIGLGIVEVNRFLHRVLTDLGVVPEAIAGHSIGEWSGMIVSGMIPGEEADAFIKTLKPGSLEVPGVLFAAAGCAIEKARHALEGLSDIAVSHDNCPHQVILCGREESIQTATSRLKENGVLCHILPFRSGFHSPLFSDYLAPHIEHFSKLKLAGQKIPLWSTTTCEPYPATPEAVRDLAADHLVKPVRFRELIERFYAEGFRVFIQAGTGSLKGFVEDTLKGREHLAASANVPDQSGLDQLRRLAAALYMEGAPVDLKKLFPETSRAPLKLQLGAPLVELDSSLAIETRAAPLPPTDDPVMAEFAALQQDMQETQRAVSAAFQKRPEDSPAPSTARLTLSVQTVPALKDHSFFPQPKDWPNIADGYPVVPMTMSLALMMKAAQELMPGRVAVRVEDMRAMRWIVVEPALEVEIKATPVSDDRVHVAIEGYAEAEVLLKDTYPDPPPSSDAPLSDPKPPPVDAATLYADRWMFHGPKYQGVVEMGPMGKDGIQGVLETPEGPGGLLDNAGQLFGFWVMAANDTDRLAMPVRVRSLDFYGPDPQAGERLSCTVRIRSMQEREVGANIELVNQSGLWCRIEEWVDRRFDSDPKLWTVFQRPEKNLLSELRPGGYTFYDDSRVRAPSRDWLSRRYLCEAERQEMLDAGPRRARQWLNGRIAAKDAVRHLLWQEDPKHIFPVEIQITNTKEGVPVVKGAHSKDLHISLAHTGDIAVARASRNAEVGIDAERIEARPDSFEATAFSDSERSLLPQDDRDAWIARMWSAKEAVAKARGSGFGGNPRRFIVSKIVNQRLLVDGTWVATVVEGDLVVAWTEEG